MVEKKQPKYIIAIDTGGTFTDCIVLDEKTGESVVAKAPTTPSDFSVGVINAIAEAAELMNMSSRSLLEQCSTLKHGCTVATNAIITRHGAKVGFITTKGFEDTTLIGRSVQRVDGLSDDEVAMMPYITKPEPLVPKSRLRGVYERIDFQGNVVVPLNIEDAKEQIRYLVEDEKVEALGVSLLFSWQNPVHEQKMKELVNQMYPNSDLFVTYSHELLPLIREYGRANSVIINCFIGKIMEQYLRNLNEKLRAEGFGGSFMVMQSNGGIVSWDKVTPLRTLSSGPAGGVIGGQYMTGVMAHEKALTTDMGGTSFDVGLILDGQVGYEREPVIERWRMMLPMIKVDSIGAGGGTIARVDPLVHRLIVGPDSAGADPGPVCYDMGGTEPTVCDADLILGFLNPDYFWGGKMRLNKVKAEQAMRDRIAAPLKMEVVEAAAGIYTIINAHMADLMRRLAMRIGALPEEFMLYAFGGTGAVHAAYYGAELGVRKVLVFPTSAVFSAFGIAGADIIETRSISLGYRMPVSADTLNPRIAELVDDLTLMMEKEGFRRQDLEYRNMFNMRYRRQINYLSITSPVKKFRSDRDVTELETTWKAEFENVYGKGSAYAKAGIELVSVDVDAIGKALKPVVKSYPEGGSDPSAGLKGHRQVFFPEITKEFVRTAIYEYDKLSPGNVIEGPAIVESPTTTVVVPPEKVARMDGFRNIEITI